MSSSGLHLKKKNVSSLVQKWQKVKKEVEIEERNREEREQAIRQKLEEWKQEYNWYILLLHLVVIMSGYYYVPVTVQLLYLAITSGFYSTASTLCYFWLLQNNYYILSGCYYSTAGLKSRATYKIEKTQTLTQNSCYFDIVEICLKTHKHSCVSENV
jgi:hypothetical protein